VNYLFRGVVEHSLVVAVHNNVTIDWALRVNMRAQLGVLVKRILRKVRLPAGKLERTTQMVLEQAEALSAEWAA